MLGICSWTAPWEVSPLREKGYIGDIEMESKVFRAVTGIEMTQDDLDKAGLRAFILQRLYTMRQLKSRNPRQDHDQYPEWIFWDPKGKAPFTKGTIRMERSDIEKSFDLFYGLMDFDVKTGAPTEKVPQGIRPRLRAFDDEAGRSDVTARRQEVLSHESRSRNLCRHECCRGSRSGVSGRIRRGRHPGKRPVGLG